MKLEKQVVSLELAKRLKELGVEQESLFYWKGQYAIVRNPLHKITGYKLENYTNGDAEDYSAFTCFELGELLPDKVLINHYYCILYINKNYTNTSNWCVYYSSFDGGKGCSFQAKTEAGARAQMLIYLLENKLILKENKDDEDSKCNQ